MAIPPTKINKIIPRLQILPDKNLGKLNFTYQKQFDKSINLNIITLRLILIYTRLKNLSKEFLFVIPARKGSSFHRKNLQLVNGKPLCRYTFDASEISIPHETLLTTDDQYVITEAHNFEFIIDNRPENLCDGIATLDDVMYYIAKTYSDYLNYVCLPPTSPLRTKLHIQEAIDTFKHSNADSLISVTEELKSIWTTDDDNFIRPLIERTQNRQQVKPCYIANGAIFISKRELILKNRKKASGKTMLYVMDYRSSVDVHSPEDIKLAEFYLK